MNIDSDFLFICERELSLVIVFLLVLTKAADLVASVRASLALVRSWASSRVSTSPSSVLSSSSDDGSGSNKYQLKYIGGQCMYLVKLPIQDQVREGNT